jgi:group I intron endonuclease
MNTYTDFPDKPDNGYGFIYFLRSPSGKGYIGQTTVSISKRLYCHTKSKGCRFLYAAIKKYGLDNFFVGAVGCYPLSDLDAMEVRFIKEFETLCPDGYNLTTGGYGNHKCSDETRKRMSEAQKGKPKSEGHKRRLSEGNTGKPMSENTKAALLTANIGKPMHANTKAALMEANLGNHLSDEHKRRLSAAKKGKPKSEDHKRRLSEGWRLKRLRGQDELSLFTANANGLT